MSDKPTSREMQDEAYMQDAIAAAKASGTLHEVNPQDAPAPVQQSNFAAKARKTEIPELADAKVTAEDKAFGHLERLQQQRAKNQGQQHER